MAEKHLGLGGGTWVLIFAAVVVMAALLSASDGADDCGRHVELHSGAHVAKELGRSEVWVVANYRIKLWQNPSPSKGKPVGEMRVGSRAVILEEAAADYKVASPLDKSTGWVGKVQVARTLYQDRQTFKPCTPKAKS